MKEIEIPSNTWHHIPVGSRNFLSIAIEIIQYETEISSNIETELTDVYKIFVTNDTFNCYKQVL